MKERSKNKIQVDYKLDDIYEYYNDQHKEDELTIDRKTFKSIIYSFNKKVLEGILDNSETFKMPKRLGTIRIKKTKMSFNDGVGCKIDWELTKKYNKKIYHLNDHTDNYRYRFYWQKTNCNAINKTAYSFNAARSDKRRLAYLLKNKITDYFL